jgi:NADH-quinone oxidoreductase subunit E
MKKQKSVQKIILAHEPIRDNLLVVLQEINQDYGFISREQTKLVADYFQVTPAQVYAVITSSSILKAKPGRSLEVKVCTGPHCQVKGSSRVLREIEKYFNIKADKGSHPRVELQTMSCPGCCKGGPVIMINGNFYSQVRPEQVDDILKNYL